MWMPILVADDVLIRPIDPSELNARLQSGVRVTGVRITGTRGE